MSGVGKPGAHNGADRNVTGPWEHRADLRSYAIARQVNALLPLAAAEAKRSIERPAGVTIHRVKTGPRGGICGLCGWQSTAHVIDARCVDLGACAKRAETWR